MLNADGGDDNDDDDDGDDVDNYYYLCQLIFFSIKFELAISNPVCHPVCHQMSLFDHLSLPFVISLKPPCVSPVLLLSYINQLLTNHQPNIKPKTNLPTTAPK